MKALKPEDSSISRGGEINEAGVAGTDSAGRRLRLSWAHSRHKDQPRQTGSSRQKSPGPNREVGSKDPC